MEARARCQLRGPALSIRRSGRAPRSTAQAAATCAATTAPVFAPNTKVGNAVGPYTLVPAYKGKAIKLQKGQLLQVVNTHGQQVRIKARSMLSTPF